MPHRLIHSEPFSLRDGEIKPLSLAFSSPGSPNTVAATITLLGGGTLTIPPKVHFRAMEDESPSSSDRFLEIGDELDVIGSEDLRLLKLLAVGNARLEISYFGGGDQL